MELRRTDLELTKLKEKRFFFVTWFENGPMGRRPLWRSTTLHSGKTTSAPAGKHPLRPSLYKMDEVYCHSDTELNFEGEAKSTDMLRNRQQGEERLLLCETGTQERSRGTCSGACSRSRIEHRPILRIA